MAFLIPDNAKSRQDIPTAIRRVLRAFQLVLDEDVTVWYEPPFDPSGERPHIVVIDPRTGVLLVEVFDAAEVDSSRTSGVLGVVRGAMRAVTDGTEHELASPLERAEAFAQRLRERVASRPETAAAKVGSVAVLAGLDEAPAKRLGLAAALDLSRCLFKADLDAAIKEGREGTILGVFERAVGESPDEELSSDVIDLLRGLIHPDVVIEAPSEQPSLFAGQLDEDIVTVMDRGQESLAKSLGSGHRVIRGVAGSGKTLVLVARAKLLSRLFPSRQILVTCYTKALAGQLREVFSDSPNVEVDNLDRIASRLISRAGLKFPGYDNDGEPVYVRARQALREIPLPKYRAVLVDEAQDFGTEALRLCVELLEATDPDDQDLVIVADSAQNIFRRNFRWKDAGIMAQGRSRILRKNYRNTHEVLTFAHDFLVADHRIQVDDLGDADDEFTIIPAESTERAGPWPDAVVMENALAEVQKVVETVKARYHDRLRSRSIAILHGSELPGEPYRPKLIVEALEATEIPCYWVTDPANPSNKGGAGSADESVIVSTIASAKGLEYPHVVLCGLGARDDLVSARKEIYVGMTRATETLSVVTSKGSPFLADIARLSK